MTICVCEINENILAKDNTTKYFLSLRVGVHEEMWRKGTLGVRMNSSISGLSKVL